MMKKEGNFTRASYLRFDRLGVVSAMGFGIAFDALHQHQLQWKLQNLSWVKL